MSQSSTDQKKPRHRFKTSPTMVSTFHLCFFLDRKYSKFTDFEGFYVNLRSFLKSTHTGQ